MNIGITLKPHSYTPEAYAYEKYLTKRGWSVQLDYENNLDPNNDINIYFMGLRPFFGKKDGRALEIHEYQSLSTPPYAKVKDFFKKIINCKPSGRIFLNDFVFKDLNISDNIPYIYRDMGIDKQFFQTQKSNPEYDIIYSGSINRLNVPEVILALANKYKIIVVGNLNGILKEKLRHSNITLTGRMERYELPELYSNARFGLNYTPDVYPFNIQTSTKTLEYLASGLPVISNRYTWIEMFAKEVNKRIIWLDDFLNFGIDLGERENNFIDMSEYSWENILNHSGLESFLRYEISCN